MNKKSAGLLSALLVLSTLPSAQAELFCPAYVPRPFSLIETKIKDDFGNDLVGKHIDCKKVGVAANMVTNIRKMLKGGLATPDTLKFRMIDTYDNAYFSPEDISLNVPYQMMIDTYAKNPVYSVPVWAHEYGHAVLDRNLDKAMPAWLSHLRKHAFRSAGVPEEMLQMLIGGYHEFFADVIAVLYTGKGDIVARSLYMTGFITGGNQKDCPNKQEGCRPRQNQSNDIRLQMTIPRDFTARENQFGRWKGAAPDDAHALLAPSRFHIYKYYLSNPSYRHQEAKLAKVTADAIVGDVGRRLKRMQDANGNISRDSFETEMTDVQRTNREFILTLDRYFEKAGMK